MTHHPCDWPGCESERERDMLYCATHLGAEIERWLADGDERRRVASDELSRVMEFEHVIRVHDDGTVSEPAGVRAPDVYEYDGEIDMAGANDWTLLNGYSGQYGYSGPVMHASEFIGGRMADDILATPGLYAAVVVTSLDESDQESGDNVAGWAVAHKDDEESER